MMRPIRLIPITMLTAFLLLGLKTGEAVRDGRMIVLSFTEEAHAQQSPPAGTAAASPAASPATDAIAKPASKEGEPKVNTPSTDVSTDDADEESARHEFSQVEIDLLQSLAKRREELDDWAKQVQLKENMLVAVEGRIDEKTANLEKMKKEVEVLLAKYNEQEDLKIRSLVKIYESMKPKDAARIFEELDMPVLLMVVDRMSERKVGAVLASMSPTKAKDVTVQLAALRKLQKNRTAEQAAASPPPGGR
jgi:flagellar motility protein MotE (MotC chaperone)